MFQLYSLITRWNLYKSKQIYWRIQQDTKHYFDFLQYMLSYIYIYVYILLHCYFKYIDLLVADAGKAYFKTLSSN